jgi:tetratricopeptide (TPR) repeat protein
MTLAKDAESPAIVRATALADLRPYLSAGVIPALEAGLADPDAMVRGAALDVLLGAPPQERIQLALGLIDDPSRIVRIKAARVLAIMPDQGGNTAWRAQLDKVFAEYVASQRANADRPEAHLNLGLYYIERRDPKQAEAEYRAALALQSDFIPADVNLADLYRSSGRDADAEKVLTGGLQLVPGNADLLHALGLLRVRQKRLGEALPLLEAAAHADPNNPRYAYVYGVALHDSSQGRQGMAVLQRALVRFPGNPELLSALAAYARDAGDRKHAAAYAERLSKIAPPPAGTEQ